MVLYQNHRFKDKRSLKGNGYSCKGANSAENVLGWSKPLFKEAWSTGQESESL